MQKTTQTLLTATLLLCSLGLKAEINQPPEVNRIEPYVIADNQSHDQNEPNTPQKKWEEAKESTQKALQQSKEAGSALWQASKESSQEIWADGKSLGQEAWGNVKEKSADLLEKSGTLLEKGSNKLNGLLEKKTPEEATPPKSDPNNIL